MIHWLHLTDQDLSRARQVIDSFKEDDTVDVLGFQRISERFDDWCYPAVTTPMTRARYYLFVPAIYAHLESQKLGFNACRERAERMQHELRKKLFDKEGRGKGVIGQRAGEDLKRLPAAVYWSALSALGILHPRGDGRRWSEAEYQRDATSREADSVETDEGVDDHPGPPRYWDSDLPVAQILTPRSGLRDRLGLTLTAPEARYLLTCFRSDQERRESLLLFRVRLKLRRQYDYAWDVLEEPGVPPRLRNRLEHARAFSSMARAMSLVYAALVIEKQRQFKAGGGHYDDSIKEIANEFEFWWANGRHFVVRGWDVSAFQQLVGLAVCGSSDRQCFELLARLARESGSAAALFMNRSLRGAITQRESQKRPGKCRLCGRKEHRKYLEQWTAPQRADEAFQLTYRHQTGDTIVRDLLRQPFLRRRDVQD